MIETKSPLRSLTVVSAALSGALSLLGLLGITPDPRLSGDIAGAAGQLATALLSAAAVYGRIRATTRIGR